MLDQDKYGRYVDQVQNLDITTIAVCHTPVIEGEFIDQAFARVRELPTLDPRPSGPAGSVRARPDHRRDLPATELTQFGLPAREEERLRVLAAWRTRDAPAEVS